ncbi:MAG: nitroreductase family protein [Candidatus Electrothrix sp. AR3]|nr:nitroreductase family protein [Candidatus Electrothrix sp. AR3]
MTEYLQEAIKNRRSIREFTTQPVDLELLEKIITAGIWAPSGLNNQPWRFVIIRDSEIGAKLATLTHYSHIIAAAPALIAVYLDQEKMYDPVKDHQAAGACIQNMLLAAHELGLGTVWLGQILKNKSKVNDILQLSNQYDLMAVVALGYPQHTNQQSQRLPLQDVILHKLGGTDP